MDHIAAFSRLLWNFWFTGLSPLLDCEFLEGKDCSNATGEESGGPTMNTCKINRSAVIQNLGLPPSQSRPKGQAWLSYSTPPVSASGDTVPGK